MVVQCPHCETGHLLDDADFKNHAQIELQCMKCQSPFIAAVPVDPASNVTVIASKPQRSEAITAIVAQTKLPVGKKVSLVVLEGPIKGTVFQLTKPEVTIGRAETNFVVDDPEVSANHCALEVRGSYAVLTDLGSTNGTFVGDEQIKRARLEHLTEFRIGETIMMFVVTENVEAEQD